VRFASRPRPVCNTISASRPATWRPCDRSTVANIERRAGFRRDRAPVYPANAATVRPCAACQRFNRPRRIPATSNAASVRACQRFASSGKRPATPQPFAPRNRSGQCQPQPFNRAPRLSAFRPSAPDSGQCRRILPAVRSTVARPPCNRRNRSTLARLNRAENGLASRPPLRPCPRPSEMRRAFCKPSATVCNAISGKRPQPWRTSRQASASRHHRTPPDSSPVYPAMIPASRATVRATIAGNAPQPPALAFLRAGRVRARPAVPRPCKAV